MYEKNFFLKSWFRKSLQFLPVATASISWVTKLYRVVVGIVSNSWNDWICSEYTLLPTVDLKDQNGRILFGNEWNMNEWMKHVNVVYSILMAGFLVELSPFIYKKFPFRAFIGTLKCFELFEYFNCGGEFPIYCVPKRYQTIFTESLYFIEVC